MLFSPLRGRSHNARGTNDSLWSSVVHLGGMSLCLKLLLCDQYVLEWVGVISNACQHFSLHLSQTAHITGHADQFGLFLSATLKLTLVVCLVEQRTRLDYGLSRSGLMTPCTKSHPPHPSVPPLTTDVWTSKTVSPFATLQRKVPMTHSQDANDMFHSLYKGQLFSRQAVK